MLTQSYKKVSPRPFLKWAGGKSKLIAQYKPYLPKHFTTYYEPFLGGGALFFALQPSRAFLWDINSELINTYLCLQHHLDELILHLKQHSVNHNSSYYYQIRASMPENEVERAARFIYLNKTCFNGLYRVNSKGKFNVPMGKYKNPTICNSDLLSAASVALQNATLKVNSFEAILSHATDEQDFVYFDPPYHPISPTSNFTDYTSQNFGENEQKKLKEVFRELQARGVKVMLSNSDCAFIRELYKDFRIIEISAARSINSNPQKRGKITELLITSYST